MKKTIILVLLLVFFFTGCVEKAKEPTDNGTFAKEYNVDDLKEKSFRCFEYDKGNKYWQWATSKLECEKLKSAYYSGWDTQLNEIIEATKDCKKVLITADNDDVILIDEKCLTKEVKK